MARGEAGTAGSRSSTVTRTPARARPRALSRPTGPPPTMTTSSSIIDAETNGGSLPSACHRVLPVDQPRPTERFDALGLILLSPGLALVIYGLAQSSSHGGFGAPEVFVPILVGFVLLALFVRHG